ncbi:PREDICTED: uncharacterized protein LOC104782760 isoform X2 [Camelina sativa]|uniref:Uncharacterized protein LOC104782760 isoform X2 n=1 Tax=Camelina sativa TaxID=90675 RepID=A0ABM1RNJ4_CAMSA|nr:PREDICTED: uncharacterized protein LOC104782760 isoform X2 [Camelina sativa]
MTTIDSGECIGSEKTSITRDESAEDSLKIDSLPLVKNEDSVEEMISPKKQVKSSPFTSLSEKDGEIIHSDSIEVSFSETSLEVTEAMDVECPGVDETGSTFLEENKVGEELKQSKEVSEISTKSDQFGDDVRKIEDVVETDGCVVSISDVKESLNFEKKKKGQDSDVQMLLEAEKRRSLAEIEGGTIFNKKVDVDTLARASEIHKIEKNGKGSKEKHEKVERVRVKDNAFVGRSVNIDLVDDTALFDVVPFYKKGKDHPKRPGTDKDAPRKHKKVAGEKPIEKGNASSKVSDFLNRGDLNGKQSRIMYSRKQMESMRYAHIADQKKLWSDMYARLLPELVTEYEGLVYLKNYKSSKSGISILGPVSAVPRRNRVNIFVH